MPDDPFQEARDEARRRAAGADDGDGGLSEDEERNVREGIGGTGSRAGDSRDRDRDRDDDDERDSGLSEDEERNVREGIGGSGSRAGGGDDGRTRAGEEQQRAREAAESGGFSPDNPLGGDVGTGRPRAREGGDVRLQREADRERSPEGGDVRLLEESQRQRGRAGGDVRLLLEEEGRRERQRESDLRNVIEGVGGAGSRAGRGRRAPNFAGGDVRLLTASLGSTVGSRATDAAADSGLDVSEARRDPVGFLRGAGPRREAAFLDSITGGALREGREAEREFRASVTPGEDVFTQQDVANLLQTEIAERESELTTAATVGLATPEPVSSIGGAVGLGLVGVAAASQATEIETPERPVGECGELATPEQPGLGNLAEISVPEGQQRVSPSEIGLPDDLFVTDEGEIPVTIDGPGRITEDGDIEVPIEATQLISRPQLEEERDETEPADEERVVVEVPDEFIPDEELTIGRESDEPVDEIQETPPIDEEADERDRLEERISERQPGDIDREREATEPTFDQVFSPAVAAEADLPTATQAAAQSPGLAGAADDRQLSGSVSGLLGVEPLSAGQPTLSPDAATVGETAVPGLLSPTLSGVGAAQTPAQAPRQAPLLDTAQVTRPRFDSPAAFAEPSETPEAPEDLYLEEPRRPGFGRPQPRRGDIRRPELTLDLDADEESELFGLIGGAGEELVDFRNPLTGEVLETRSALRSDTPEFNLPGL